MANSNLKSDPKSVKLEDIGSSLLNPSTEETLVLVKEAIENITIPAPTGGATEAKQDDIITAIGNVKIDTGDIDLNTDGLEAGQADILTELKQKTQPTDIQLSELIITLRSLVTAIANPSYVDKSANQMRAQITGSLTTAGTVSTVTTVTNLTNIGSYSGDHLQRMDNMTAWATNVRSLIT